MDKIHIYLTGRLGNQLFQYAFGKALQKKYGGKIYVNTYEFDFYAKQWEKKHGKFSYELGKFNISNNVVKESVKLPWYADLRNPVIRVAKNVAPNALFSLMATKGVLMWQQEKYIQIPELNSREVICNGWWQDIKYFDSVKDELKLEIEPKTKLNLSNLYLYNLAKSISSVCISIRGGNYLAKGIKEHFYVCDQNYFYDAILNIKKYISNPIFIVFSDDIEWVKKEINLEKMFPKDVFFYESGVDSTEEKLRLMSSCSNFIISNSTFSWWAQYLSKNSKKIVIAPNMWYTNGKKCGLYENGWKLIPIKRFNK